VSALRPLLAPLFCSPSPYLCTPLFNHSYLDGVVWGGREGGAIVLCLSCGRSALCFSPVQT